MELIIICFIWMKYFFHQLNWLIVSFYEQQPIRHCSEYSTMQHVTVYVEHVTSGVIMVKTYIQYVALHQFQCWSTNSAKIYAKIIWMICSVACFKCRFKYFNLFIFILIWIARKLNDNEIKAKEKQVLQVSRHFLLPNE